MLRWWQQLVPPNQFAFKASVESHPPTDKEHPLISRCSLSCCSLNSAVLTQQSPCNNSGPAVCRRPRRGLAANHLYINTLKNPSHKSPATLPSYQPIKIKILWQQWWNQLEIKNIVFTDFRLLFFKHRAKQTICCLYNYYGSSFRLSLLHFPGSENRIPLMQMTASGASGSTTHRSSPQPSSSLMCKV